VSLTRLFSSVALAAALIVPVAASAQQAPAAPPAASAAHHGGRHHHGHRHSAMRAALSKLNLSPAQRGQIDAAMKQTREADRAAVKANREKLRSQIDGVLSPAQRTQLRSEMQAMRARHTHRANGAPGA
jgi:Spy/CpxP family protein refolding chaperone